MPLTMRPQPSCTKTWLDEIPNTLYSQPDEWRRCTPFSSPSTPTRRHIPINAWESFTTALHTAEFRTPVLSGHRHDVCASPKTTFCSRCGIELPLQEPPCTPKCILCEGSHLTGTGSCEGRNLHQPCEQMKQPQTQLQEPVPRGDNAPPGVAQGPLSRENTSKPGQSRLNKTGFFLQARTITSSVFVYKKPWPSLGRRPRQPKKKLKQLELKPPPFENTSRCWGHR
ncbi:hypothetical protein MRX96_024834 [Rhipicephalus microplus]